MKYKAKKSKNLLRWYKRICFFCLTMSFYNFSYAFNSCKVGDMSCKRYCSGALVVKIYQLINQGVKPLCNIDLQYIGYQSKKNLCNVQIDKIKQSFDQQSLIKIALTSNRDSFNKLLNEKFKRATYLCPNNGHWY